MRKIRVALAAGALGVATIAGSVATAEQASAEDGLCHYVWTKMRVIDYLGYFGGTFYAEWEDTWAAYEGLGC